MKISKEPVIYTPRKVKCTGEGSCGAEMEDVQLNDMKRIHHPAESDGPAYHTPEWEEVFINCMGCNRRLRIYDLHSYHVSKVELQKPNNSNQWQR